MGLGLLRIAVTDSLTLSEDLKARELSGFQISSSVLFIGSKFNNLVFFFLCLSVHLSRADLVKDTQSL